MLGRVKLKKDEILIIDSLHGLFPDMTKDVPDEKKFKLYLEPLLQMKDSNGKYIRWSDIRMIRRMLRDEAYRAYDPRRTLEHWHYVRVSELRNIIPYVNTTDFVINSSMPYELSIYHPKLISQFEEWVADYREAPLREDAYKRAARVYQVLKEILPVEDESSIPADSIIREFIGGSCFEY